jgi:Ca-activated chloride channel family protein
MFGNTVYQQVLVSVDENQSKRVAEIGGGKFYRATDTNALKQIFEDINELEKVPIESQRSRQLRELFAWPLGLGLASLLTAMLWSLSLGRKLP